MDIFSSISPYYDTIYGKKPYKREATLVDLIIKRHIHKKFISILDLGCGTGEHIIHLTQKGYSLTGVDLSPQMLLIAQKKCKSLNIKARLVHGDVQKIKLGYTYDVITSLFHVMSYQVENAHVLSFLHTIKTHLRRGGIAMVDFWYGPGVLNERPKTQSSTYRTKGKTIHRIKDPRLNTVTNTVDVSHTLYVHDTKSRVVQTLQEIHTMRYFFFPEIILFLQSAGLKLITWGVLEEKGFTPPSDSSWEACALVTHI